MSTSLLRKRVAKIGSLRNFRGPQNRRYYQSLLRRLSWPSYDNENGLVTVGITSSLSGEGASTVAMQLAITAAGFAGNRILLVDYNIARPSITNHFRLTNRPGMVEILKEGGRVADCLQPTSIANLSCLTAGIGSESAEFVYDSFGLPEMVESLRADFDLVVFDMPPVGKASDATRLAGLADGILLVVEAERVRWEVALKTKDLLLRANADLLGVVFNKRKKYVPGWLYRTL